MRLGTWLVRCVGVLVLVFAPVPGSVMEGHAKDDAPTPEAPDALQEVLDRLGVAAEQLGYRPKAHWQRYPHPSTTPYVMPFFSDLLAAPLDTYAFTRTLGNAVEDNLTPKAMAGGPKALECFFRLGVLLGTERRIGGIRGYSANLTPQVVEQEPLLESLITLLARAGRPLVRASSFGGQYDREAAPRARLRKRLSVVPEVARAPLAALVLNLCDARTWIDLGLRRITPSQRHALFDALPLLAGETEDGTAYAHVVDDIVPHIDEQSLHYGSLKALQALQNAARELAGKNLASEEAWRFELATPWGDVVFEGGATQAAPARREAPMVWVRLTGDAPIKGPLAATSPRRALSVGLDLGSGGSFETSPGGRSASGVLGCGALYVAGKTDTRYSATAWSQGCACVGFGALIDGGGDDTYELRHHGQGGALFGSGLLLDVAGSDTYRLLEGSGQGYGGPGGVGVLGDRSGDDHYYAEPLAKKAGRADYHSGHKIAANSAQGVGSGRRGDGSDGHSWAGGLGALLDVDGNDRYEAGNFSQGLGYWYGTGLLWDGGGNDHYKSVYFTQGSGAHFAIGALIDESGEDTHELWETAGAALGFGWDVVNAFLIDRGQGNDTYNAKKISLGVAEVRSNAFFIDEGGDDTYRIPAKGKFLGDVDNRPQYTKPRRTVDFSFRIDQIGVFLDLGGNDTYDVTGGKPSTPYANDASWHVRTRDPSATHGFNVSLGQDRASGVLEFLRSWPARTPPDAD